MEPLGSFQHSHNTFLWRAGHACHVSRGSLVNRALSAAGERLDKNYDDIRQIALTIFGAGLNLPLAVFVLLTGFAFFTPTSVPGTQAEMPFVVLVVAYFIFGVVYAGAASFAFSPKRIVSPTQMQLITAGLFSAYLLFYSLTYQTYADLLTAAGFAIGFFILATALFVPTGIVQTKVLTILVGLSGSESDVITMGIVADAPPDTVRQILRDKPLRRELDVAREVILDGDIHVLASRTFLKTSWTSLAYQMYFAVAPRKDWPNECEIILVAYRKQEVRIAGTHRLEEHCKNEIGYIMLRLRQEQIESHEEEVLEALPATIDYALGVTKPKLASIARLPTRNLLVTLAALAFLIFIVAMWIADRTTLDTVLSVIVLYLLAALAMIYPGPRPETKLRG